MEEFKIPATMKAMTLVAYDQLKLAEVPVPEPGPGRFYAGLNPLPFAVPTPK